MSGDDLTGLIADLRRAGGEAVMRRVEAVVKKAAVNVKRDWRDNALASSGVHTPRYPYSITFDEPVREGKSVSVEIGPDKAKSQGALGNLLEYGSVNNPPHNDGKRAAEAEAPRFERELGKVADGIWETSIGVANS